MRTTDFSRAPSIGQAGAQFVGGTKLTGPIAFVGLVRRWFPLVRRMKRSRGYSSGVWRAEAGHELRAIEQFTPLSHEHQGPAVPPDAARGMIQVVHPGCVPRTICRRFNPMTRTCDAPTTTSGRYPR